MSGMIRPAILDDAPAILALRNGQEAVFWSGVPPISATDHAVWFPQNLQFIIVLDDGGVRGYARLNPHGRVSFAMHPDWTGKGYGKQLLFALESVARKHQIKKLWAEVHPSNIASMRVFMHLGYALEPMPMLSRYERVFKAI